MLCCLFLPTIVLLLETLSVICFLLHCALQVGLVFQFPERHFLGDDVMAEMTFTWPRDVAYWGQRQAMAVRMQRVSGLRSVYSAGRAIYQYSPVHEMQDPHVATPLICKKNFRCSAIVTGGGCSGPLRHPMQHQPRCAALLYPAMTHMLT